MIRLYRILSGFQLLIWGVYEKRNVNKRKNAISESEKYLCYQYDVIGYIFVIRIIRSNEEWLKMNDVSKCVWINTKQLTDIWSVTNWKIYNYIIP